MIIMSTHVKVYDEKSHVTNHISKEEKCIEDDECLQEGQHKRNNKKKNIMKNKRKKIGIHKLKNKMKHKY